MLQTQEILRMKETAGARDAGDEGMFDVRVLEDAKMIELLYIRGMLRIREILK